jgi:hypothetical protein
MQPSSETSRTPEGEKLVEAPASPRPVGHEYSTGWARSLRLAESVVAAVCYWQRAIEEGGRALASLKRAGAYLVATSTVTTNVGQRQLSSEGPP